MIHVFRGVFSAFTAFSTTTSMPYLTASSDKKKEKQKTRLTNILMFKLCAVGCREF
jgi:hypothetical protein